MRELIQATKKPQAAPQRMAYKISIKHLTSTACYILKITQECELYKSRQNDKAPAEFFTNFNTVIYPKDADNTHEVIKMSPKELLYIEDALSHTQYLMTQCRTAANQLSDPVLRQQAQQLVNANQKLFTQFYNLV